MELMEQEKQLSLIILLVILNLKKMIGIKNVLLNGEIILL